MTARVAHAGRRRLRPLIALIVAGLFATSLHAASATQTAVQVWVAERVSPQAKGYTLWANFSWGVDGGLVANAVFRRRSCRLVPVGGLAWDADGNDGPYASVAGTDYGCVPGSQCSLSGGWGLSAYASTTPDSLPPVDVVLLVIKGSDQQVTLHNSPGWRLRKTRLKATLISSRATANQAVVVGGQRLEHFTDSTGLGTAHGSVAIADPPCKPAERVGYAREGQGTATLSGGRESAPTDCSPGGGDAVAVADHATRWNFSGDVTGIAMGPTRLVVVDLDTVDRP